MARSTCWAPISGIIVFGMLTSLGLPAYSLSLSLVITVLVSMAFCALYGATIERVAYRPLRNAAKLAPLISAVGMSIILQNFVMLSQGKEYKNLPPQLPSEGFSVLGANISPAQMFILSASILIMIVLHLFVSRTRLGKAMRATSQDRVMAGLVGININQVISVTFMIGSGACCCGRRHGHALLRCGPFFHGIPGRHQGLYCGGAGRHRQHSRAPCSADSCSD